MEAVTQLFLQSAAREEIVVTAYCFMPDHVHLLLSGDSERADARRMVKDARQRTGYHFARSHPGRLWQKGYYDRILRDEEQTLPVIRYILANPLRAGMTQGLGEYPYAAVTGYSIPEIAECFQTWDPPRVGGGGWHP